MNALLIGGSGFLGTHVALRLESMNVPFRIIDPSDHPDPLCPRPFEKGHPCVVAKRSEECLEEVLEEWRPNAIVDMETPDVIVHMACLSLRETLYGGSERALRENAAGVARMLDTLLARQWKGRLVYVSSSEVYGDAPMPATGFSESDTMQPITPYAAAKYAAERYVLYTARHCGMDAVVVRPFNMYGPYSHYEGKRGEVIPRFSLLALHGETLPVNADTSRDFLWVEDGASGIVRAVTEGKAGEDYNLATGVSTSIRTIADMIIRETGAGTLRVGDSRRGDTPRLKGDARKAIRELGWKPEVSLEEGLGRYLQWLRGNGFDLAAMRGAIGGAAASKSRHWGSKD